MNQKINVLVAEFGLGDQVGFVFCTSSDIGEDFLVQKGDGVAIDIGGNFREEELQKVPEEGGEQFFEEAFAERVLCTIVINHWRIWQR